MTCRLSTMARHNPELHRNNVIDKAFEVIHFIASRSRTTPKDLAQHLGVCNKTASRWLLSISTSKFPIEVMGDIENSVMGKCYRFPAEWRRRNGFL